MLDPDSWSYVGYAIFWSLFAWIAPNMAGTRRLFEHRFNPLRWMDELCLVLAVMCFCPDSSYAWPLAWLRDNIAYALPGALYDLLAAIFGWIGHTIGVS